MRYLCTILLFLTVIQGFSQSFYAPDDNFEQALIDLGYDDVLDDSVLYSNTDGVSFLNLADFEIESLEGIGAFTELFNLVCSNNNLEALDISENVELVGVICQNNGLTELDLTTNVNLQVIYCGWNELTTIDLSPCTELRDFYGQSNEFTEIDFSSNLQMKKIHVSVNEINSLDVTDLTLLEDVDINDNEIEELDLSNNLNLERLICSTNELTELDVSNCAGLTQLQCGSNPFTELDLLNNPTLLALHCDYSNLVELNLDNNPELGRVVLSNGILNTLSIQNGNNHNIENFVNFDLMFNPNLGCVNVDDEAYCDSTWTWVDEILDFSLDCESVSIEEVLTIDYKLYPNPTSDDLFLELNSDAYSMNLYSVDGTLLMTTTLNAGKNKIDLSGLAEGLYLLEVAGENNVYTERIIIH